MKKLLAFILMTTVMITSCKEEVATCKSVQRNTSVPAAEKDSIQRYITANSITAVRDTSGIFYTVANAGTGAVTPEVCSFITVRYNGKTFSGQHIDSTIGTSTFTSQLAGLIEGWEKGIPKIKTGGSVTLYIPPTLAYGAGGVRDVNNNVVIPGNAYLKFKIDVVNVQ